MNWKIGQKLVCIDSVSWSVGIGPAKGEVVTFNGAINEYGHLGLKEYECYDAYYSAIYFRPLLGESAKSELISSFTEVTETSDLPIKQPEPQTV